MKTRSLVASVGLFGAGAVVGAGAAWLIMLAASSDRDRDLDLDRGVSASDKSRQRCSDQLRSILADVEVRLMDAVDELVSHFSLSTGDSDKASKSTRKPSPRDSKRSKSQCVNSSFNHLTKQCTNLTLLFASAFYCLSRQTHVSRYKTLTRNANNAAIKRL